MEDQIAFAQSPEGINAKLQEQRIVLSEALTNQQFQFIHDQAYYVQGLVDALKDKLDADKAAQLEPLLSRMSKKIDKLHDLAGSKKEAAVQAQLEDLYAEFDQLQSEVKGSAK